jgi:hypothetical protein
MGGAVASEGSNLLITDCIFQNNILTPGSGQDENFPTGADGGAVCVFRCATEIHRSSFINNTVSDRSGSLGGGGALFASEGSTAILDSRFVNNSIPHGGAGAISLSSTGFVFRCVFRLNSSAAFNAPYGSSAGGAIAHNLPLQIDQCVFDHNSAKGRDAVFGADSSYPPAFRYFPASVAEGGAIASYGTLSVSNSVFFANSVRSGNSIQSSPPSPSSFGAALSIRSTAQITHCSFSSNYVELSTVADPTPPKGSAIFCETNAAANLAASLLSFVDPVPLIRGPVIDGGFNVCADGSGGFTQASSLNNTDPQLRYFPDQTFSILRPATGSPAIGRVTMRLTDYEIRGALRGALPHDSGAVELDGTTVLAVSVTNGILSVSAPGYSDPLTLLGSGDLSHWTEVGTANPKFSVSVGSGPQFFKALLGP